MTAVRPTVSVVIVSYNTRAMTLECLRTLYDRLGGLTAEVFVVDNGSSDGSADAVAKAFPDVRLIRNEGNRGFAAANNQAIRLASADYLLLLNSDAFPKPGAVTTLVEQMAARPDLAVLGPRLLNRDESLQKSCYRFPGPMRSVCENLLLTAMWPNNRLVGDYRGWGHDGDRDVEFVIGACLLVRRSAIDSVGSFDEAFFFYGEEADWCRRFRQAGWKIAFTSAAEVYHLNGASGAVQRRAVFDEFHRAQERFVRKHHGPLGLFVYRFMMVVGAVLRMAAFGLLRLTGNRRAAGLVRKWFGILVWTLGWRGGGLGRMPHRGTSSDLAATA